MKTIALLLIGLSVAMAACPNGCSGNGKCEANDKCKCHQNWQSADCSARTCPFELAWVDTATATDTNHFYAECSNKGICDRKTAQCKCFDGYEGKACRRSTCPNDCSGHGTCEFINELAWNEDKRVGGDSAWSLTDYNNWDFNKIQGCACDKLWEGADCSSRLCPSGDDALTTGQVTMAQTIRVGGVSDATGAFYLTYHDPYGASWKTQGIALSLTDSTCAASIQTALRDIPNNALQGVTVAAASNQYAFTRTDVSGESIVYSAADSGAGTTVDTADDVDTCTVTVTFPRAPGTTGFQHLFDCSIADEDGDEGFQPLSAGVSSTIGTATCVVVEQAPASATTVHQLYENEVCSGRGACTDTGDCECWEGYKGLACETQEALV